ncbi:MAG: hypothetical protein ACKO7Z_04740 [Cyanobacteriota bacterium]
MGSPSLPAAGPDSAQVRSQLVTALELELVGPTQRVLQALGAEAGGLETEALDRLPSSWYPTGFLVPTETDLSLKCDDTADDDFAAADGVDLRKPKKANSEYKPGSGDDGGSSESGPTKPQLFPSSIGVSVLLPPGTAQPGLCRRHRGRDALSHQRAQEGDHAGGAGSELSLSGGAGAALPPGLRGTA